MSSVRKRISWPATLKEASLLQKSLASGVLICRLERPPEYLAAVDAAFSDNRVFAAACGFSYPGLESADAAAVIDIVRFPYVPGFLSFREGPAIVEAIGRLKTKPDVILVDGQGIAHPRGIGIASHIGVVLDIPTIGCAKSRLIGFYKEPGRKKGSTSPLSCQGRTVGAVVRTRDDTRPLFVSPGHRVDLPSAIAIVLGSLSGYRIPEPLRQADILAKKIKKEFLGTIQK
jgi:deoxyribonuclease V